MGRLPKIIIMIAAMTAIFLWMSTAFNSCGDKDDILDDTTETIDEIIDDTDEFVDNVSDDIFADDTEEYVDADFVTPDEATDVDFTSTDDSDDSYTPRPTYTSSSSGDYMVIAGNYLVQSNANGMTRKLSNLGYPNAEIGIFDRSQYHTVIASRHDSYGAALEVANAINRQGIECYVKKREY